MDLQHYDNYQLEQMTVLSRHNFRSPLTPLDPNVTNNCSFEWRSWDSEPGELTHLGGQCEKAFGNYFKSYLLKEKLIPNNWQPKDDEVLFYSNSLQRTVASAENFLAGMLPFSNIKVKHKNEIGKEDTLFFPILHGVTDDFRIKVESEVNELFDGNYKKLSDMLYDNMKLLQDVIGYKGKRDIADAEIKLLIEDDRFTASRGFCHDLSIYADALVMQYFEELEDADTIFGRKMGFKEWKQIGDILSAGILLVCGSRTESMNTMHDMLQEFKKHMDNTNRKFTFLCGHDVTLTPFLSALDVKWASLPYTITDISPIGGKVVFSKFKNINDEKFIQVNYVYETIDQIRNCELLDLDNPPIAYPLEFKGLNKNSDGFYKLLDIEDRFLQSINSIE